MNNFLKYAQIWLLGLLMLNACHNKSADTVQDVARMPTVVNSTPLPRPTDMPATSKTDSTVRKMRAILGGAWLNTSYTAYLQKTRSPRQADGHWGSGAITEMLLDPQSYRGDSMAVALGTANHEGMPLRYVHLRPGKGDTSWPTTTDETESLLELSLRYQIRNADTLLSLDQLDKKTRRIATTPFRKLHGFSATKASLQDPLAYFTNGLIFAGTQTVTDSTGHISSIRFTKTGQLQGWPSYKSYQVNTDFVGPFHELDAVFFDINQKNHREMVFITNGDTVKLYDLHDDTTTYKRRRTRLCYTLVRQRN